LSNKQLNVEISTFITRQIAEEVGVSHPTVLNVVKATGKDLPVEQPTEITGKDGKKRKAKGDKPEKKPSEADMNAISTGDGAPIRYTAGRRGGCF